MRWLPRIFLLLFVLLTAGGGWLLTQVIQPSPLVNRAVVFTPAHIERAKALLERNDPRQMRQDMVRSIVVSQADLDLALNYLASRRAGGSASISLPDGRLLVRATLPLPPNPVGSYLNIEIELAETGTLPRVESVRVGRLELPPAWLPWLLPRALGHLDAGDEYAAAARVLRQLRVRDGLLLVRLQWDEAAVGRLKVALVPPADQARFKDHQAYLAGFVVAQAPAGRPLRLEELLTATLRFARRRAGGGDAGPEYRAALITVAFYANGAGLSAVVPAARDWPVPPHRGLTLARRSDTPLHFMVSAAIAASAGSSLADVVGLYKEIDDARRGSGFSFPDLAADRAGTRLGELLMSTAGAQQRLAPLLDAGLREADLLPAIQDLSEFMPEAEFRRRFGGIDQPAYRNMVATVERRIAALPLYR